MILDNKLMTAMFLSRVSFLKPKERYALFIKGYDLTSFLHMSTEDLAHILGRKVRSRQWKPEKIKRELTWHLAWMSKKQGWCCPIYSTEYPDLLKRIADPPLVLYGIGSKNALSQLAISIVGTRHPSITGKNASFDLGYIFAEKGWNVISGLAYGIDIAAHKGVLELYYKKSPKTSDYKNKMGKGIAVLGTSIDYIYPQSHIDYARNILRFDGAIISEIPPAGQSLVRKHSFIGRNRIISGLSYHVIVVQCPKKSGALATADFALEQGRIVWLHSSGLEEKYTGTQELYKIGAKCIDRL